MLITSLFFRVSLSNGGYLVIEQTEALVSIDVNGGHRMIGQGQGTSQAKAVLDVNLAAAKQVIKIQIFSPYYTSFYIIGDWGL